MAVCYLQIVLLVLLVSAVLHRVVYPKMDKNGFFFKKKRRYIRVDPKAHHRVKDSRYLRSLLWNVQAIVQHALKVALVKRSLVQNQKKDHNWTRLSTSCNQTLVQVHAIKK